MIVLVVLGVIVFSGLLDGQKKYYQDEFVVILLVLKVGDCDEFDMMLVVIQVLLMQLLEGVVEEVWVGDVVVLLFDLVIIVVNNIEFELEFVLVVLLKLKLVELFKLKVEVLFVLKLELKLVVEEKVVLMGKVYVV